MDESILRRFTVDETQATRARRRLPRAVRAALAGAAVAGAGMFAAVGAHAGSGGAAFDTGSSGTGTGACPATELGTRTLEVGDCGEDVRTLNWILKSKRFARVALAAQFGTSTEEAVRAFERQAGLKTDGVVEPSTHAAIANSLPAQLATWYGPGLYGNKTACGEKLTREIVGVAHKTLPCGSKVVLRYRGSYLRTTVIDRGPFANGAQWDLTAAAAKKLDFGDSGVDKVRVAKLAKAKRK